jgi:hypothetical protein
MPAKLFHILVCGQSIWPAFTFGGVPMRGIPHGITQIAALHGNQYYPRSMHPIIILLAQVSIILNSISCSRTYREIVLPEAICTHRTEQRKNEVAAFLSVSLPDGRLSV